MGAENVREGYDDEEVDHLEDVTERPSRSVKKKSGSRLSADDKQWAMWCHMSALAGLIVPGGNIIGPLICWTTKKDQSAFVDYHGKEAVNFQITMLICVMICIALAIVLIGFLLLPVVGILSLVMPIIAGMKANEGERYEYPYTWRFIK